MSRNHDFVVKCNKSLVSDTPDALLKSNNTLMSLHTKAQAKSSEVAGNAIFKLTCDQIDAGGVLLLMHSAIRTINLGWKVQVGGTGGALDHLLKHINHYLTPPESRSEETDELNYWLRNISSKTQMVSELENWARQVQEGSGASDEDVAQWQFQISEVTANGFQHGRSEQPMLVAGKVDSESGSVQLAALDFGETIPFTIMSHPNCPSGSNCDGKKVGFACKQGMTAQTERANQGRGLFNLVKAVKENGGTMRILSRNGLFHVLNGRGYSRNLSPFSQTCPVLDGTLVTVNLKI